MSDVKSTLTETLRAHRPTTKRINHPKRPGILLNLDACTGCEWTEQDGGDHDAHVADVLLGLSGVAVTALPDLETQFVIDYDYRSDSGPRLVGPFPSRSAAEEHADSLRGPGWEALYCISPVAAAVVSEGETR